MINLVKRKIKQYCWSIRFSMQASSEKIDIINRIRLMSPKLSVSDIADLHEMTTLELIDKMNQLKKEYSL